MAQLQTEASDFAPGKPEASGPLSQSAQQGKTYDLQDGADPFRRSATPAHDAASPDTHGDSSNLSQSQTLTPSRGGTLKKRQSLKKKSSVKRSMSGRLSRTNSMKSLGGSEKEIYAGEHADELNNAFFTPVPTSGSPTEILANRFQSWRKVLKDLITYFRDVQKSYEARAKSVHTLSNVMGNIESPPSFLMQGGIGDATKILHDYHKQTITEGNKAKSIEEEVINQLTNLRSDLGQKIKEIKSLSGDFKNSVDKETEGTRKAVHDLSDALHTVESNPSSAAGKSDPFIIRLGVDRQLERQIEEENYLHRAFLNLESSGRELESIVVGEVQKAYDAYANIISREADEAYEAVEKLRAGPVSMTKDHEWNAFVHGNEHFVDPRLPVRRAENITYPGKDDPAAAEIRSGMLERKSKYLKSYTPGWYILSPTHIHEFKSPDRITSQAPIMSLTLADQKLGSHSGTDSTSHKFMLKGRQSGGMHRGHAWVFRAETYDTMLAWFNDIKALTENTGEAKSAFIRKHARSISAGSQKAASVSSDGLDEEDEADQVPYSATSSVIGATGASGGGAVDEREKKPERPNPGGRFPSALNVNRDSHTALSSSPSSSIGQYQQQQQQQQQRDDVEPTITAADRDVIAAATALPAVAGASFGKHEETVKAAYAEAGDDAAANKRDERDVVSPVDRDNEKMVAMPGGGEKQQTTPAGNNMQSYVPTGSPTEQHMSPLTSPPPLDNYTRAPIQAQGVSFEGSGAVAQPSSSAIPPQQPQQSKFYEHLPERVPAKHPDRPTSTNYGDWMSPSTSSSNTATTTAGISGAAAGVIGSEAYRHHQDNKVTENPDKSQQAPPSSVPPPSTTESLSQTSTPQQQQQPPPPPAPTTTTTTTSPPHRPLPPGAILMQNPITAPVLPVTGPPEDPFRGTRSRAGSMGQPPSTQAPSLPTAPAEALPSGLILPDADKRPVSASPSTSSSTSSASAATATATVGMAHVENPGSSSSSMGMRGASPPGSHSMSPDDFLRRPSTVQEEVTPTPTPGGGGAGEDGEEREGGGERGDPLEKVTTISGLHVPGEYS